MIKIIKVWNKLNQGLHGIEAAIAYKRNSIRTDTASASERGQLWMAAAAFCFASAVLFSMVSLKNSEEALSSRIAPQVLRFHVLANSDSKEDQELKLEVKKMMLDTIYAQLNCLAASSENPVPLSLSEKPAAPGAAHLTKADISRYIETHGPQLEAEAEEFIAERGYSYPVSIRLEQCFFPTKVYGDVTFPCGTYDAVRILIGEGKGKNWWCVLYPPLCFTDNAYAQVPDSSKEKLRGLLDEDDFRDLMKTRRVVFGEEGKNAQGRAGKGEGSPEPAKRANSPGAMAAEQGNKTGLTVRVRFRLPELLSGSN